MKQLLVSTLGLICFSATAQHEYDTWYFGDSCAVSFNSGAPVNLSVSNIFGNEGTSTTSDGVGNLLFYTSGVFVYNANHQVMANGSGLFGHSSSTQSALVLPDLSNPFEYYVFTSGENNSSHGLRYSKVNMTLNGGLGDVTDKNVLIWSGGNEKLTAIAKPDSSGYWLFTCSGGGEYRSYPLTASGIGIPVISNIGNYTSYQIGQLKISPNGKFVARCMYTQGMVSPPENIQIARFNDTTGVVSDAFSYAFSPAINGSYGAEFSPDGNKLYVSTVWGSPYQLYQFDMTGGDSATIVGSLQLIYSAPGPQRLGAMALGPDEKIYVGHDLGEKFLGVINDPNQSGISCNYVDTGFAVLKYPRIGMPNFPVRRLQGSSVVQAVILLSDTSICSNSCISFGNGSVNGNSYEWHFPGGNPSVSTAQFPPTVCYSSPGDYDVRLIVHNGLGSDTALLPNVIHVNALPPSGIAQNGDTLCVVTDYSYQWCYNQLTVAGATGNCFAVDTNGIYQVKITDSNGCSIVDSIETSIVPVAQFTASPSTLCCGLNACISVENLSSNGIYYQWNFQGGNPSSSTENTPIICYDSTGQFDVTLIVNNGTWSDTLFLDNGILVECSTPELSVSNDTIFSNGGVTFEWFNNSATINGANDPFYVPTESGMYTVVATSSGGCTGSDTIFYYIEPSAAIESIVTKICPDTCISFANQSTNATSYEWFFQGASPSYSTDENPTNICYSTSGVYDVTLIAHNGPNSDTTVSTSLIQVYAPPSPIIVQSNDTLFATNTNASDTYQWLYNGVEIPGSTYPFIVPAQNGVYTVSVISGEGCNGSAGMNFSGVGIESHNENSISIYPNPADETLTVESSHQGITTVAVYNLLGQTVINGLVENKTVLNAALLPAGVYQVTLTTREKTKTVKLVIAR